MDRYNKKDQKQNHLLTFEANSHTIALKARSIAYYFMSPLFILSPPSHPWTWTPSYSHQLLYNPKDRTRVRDLILPPSRPVSVMFRAEEVRFHSTHLFRTILSSREERVAWIVSMIWKSAKKSRLKQVTQTGTDLSMLARMRVYFLYSHAFLIVFLLLFSFYGFIL